MKVLIYWLLKFNNVVGGKRVNYRWAKDPAASVLRRESLPCGSLTPSPHAIPVVPTLVVAVVHNIILGDPASLAAVHSVTLELIVDAQFGHPHYVDCGIVVL
jgi:hypothetical protein